MIIDIEREVMKKTAQLIEAATLALLAVQCNMRLMTDEEKICIQQLIDESIMEFITWID